MRFQLHIYNGRIYLGSLSNPALSFEAKHYVPDGQGNPTEWYLQAFSVRGANVSVENSVLLMLKRGKKAVKQSVVRVDAPGVLTVDTDSDAPLDPLSDALAAVKKRLPKLGDWQFSLHRGDEALESRPVASGIDVRHNVGAEVAVRRTTVRDLGDSIPAEYVHVTSARWAVMYRRRTARVAEIYLWPGASEEIEEIVEAVTSLC